MTSYVLGDLDISKGEGSSELGSFEISSNTSSIHSSAHSSRGNLDGVSGTDKTSSNVSKRNNSQRHNRAQFPKKFQEDEANKK